MASAKRHYVPVRSTSDGRPHKTLLSDLMPEYLTGVRATLRFNFLAPGDTIMNELIKVEKTFLGGPKHCWMCESPLPRDAHFCERCGFHIQTVRQGPVEVQTRDVVLSVIMAVVALAATLVPSYPFASAFFFSQMHSHDIPQVVVIGIWNVLILGCPILFLIRRWYTRVQRGDFNHAWVWRDYWFLQAMALAPVWFFGGVFAVVWLVRQLTG